MNFFPLTLTLSPIGREGWGKGGVNKKGNHMKKVRSLARPAVQITLYSGYSTMPWAPADTNRGIRLRTSS
jgi:hypothetical protein